MKILDLNLLLYAVNRDSAHHRATKRWLDEALSGTEHIAFTWPVLLGFIRLSTSDRVFAKPLRPEQALQLVDSWLGSPAAVRLNAGEEHWRILRDLLAEVGAAGNLTNDAHLAAIAIEHGAELCSTDRDFGRFQHLHWTNPIA